MKKLRIAFIAPQPFVEARGTPMANFRITQVLADAGHSVEVITYPFGDDPKYPGISVTRCSSVPCVRSVGIGFSASKLLLDVNLSFRALRIARTMDCDCVHGVEEGAFIGLALSRLTGKPLVYDMDSIMSHEIKASAIGKFTPVVRLLSVAERHVVRKSALVVTISESMAEYVRSVDPKKDIAVVPDIPISIPPGGADPERALSQMPSDMISNRRMIAYVGSLAVYQGLDLLISAMKRVVEAHPRVLLVVVGGDVKGVKRLATLAEGAGVMNNVLFMGKKPPGQVPDFLCAAELLISPRRGGVNPPAKIYTYMQSGTPIVATDIPAHSTVLGRDAALLVPPTPEGIADGIIESLAEPGKALRRAELAREIVGEITPELQAQRICEAYDRLAARMSETLSIQ